jgi:hypothetical protein
MLSTFTGARSQVRIVAIDPVLARGIEDVEIDGVFESEGFVRNVGRNAEDFTGVDGDFFAFEGKLQCAFEDVGDLFVVVAVQRDVCTLFEQDAGDHDAGAYYELTAYQWVQGLDFYI